MEPNTDSSKLCACFAFLRLLSGSNRNHSTGFVAHDQRSSEHRVHSNAVTSEYLIYPGECPGRYSRCGEAALASRDVSRDVGSCPLSNGLAHHNAPKARRDQNVNDNLGELVREPMKIKPLERKFSLAPEVPNENFDVRSDSRSSLVMPLTPRRAARAVIERERIPESLLWMQAAVPKLALDRIPDESGTASVKQVVSPWEDSVRVGYGGILHDSASSASGRSVRSRSPSPRLSHTMHRITTPRDSPPTPRKYVRTSLPPSCLLANRRLLLF